MAIDHSVLLDRGDVRETVTYGGRDRPPKLRPWSGRCVAGQRQVIADPGDAILLAMVDIEHARLAAETNPLDEGEHELPVHVIEAEARFVEDQERRVLHHGASDQHEALVAEREPVERLVGSVGHAEQGEPLVGDGLLGVSVLFV